MVTNNLNKQDSTQIRQVRKKKNMTLNEIIGHKEDVPQMVSLTQSLTYCSIINHQ